MNNREKFASAPGGKFLLLTIVLAALLCTLCMGALAEGELRTGTATGEFFQEGGLPTVSLRPQTYSARGTSLYDYIVEQLEAQEEEIIIESYGVTVSEMGETFVEVINNHPEMFWVDNEWGYSYIPDAETKELCTAYSLKPTYKYSGADLEARIAAFDAKLNEIVAYASGASTTLGRLMRVNDYFCVNFCYDNTYTNYAADELFAQGTGVCQAYMLGYRAVLDKLGITSTAATSEAMNHTWNMVYLDGAWYHIDVTWNDPTGPDMPYRARHFYFLVSDSAMTASRGHYDWEASATAGSTKYDDYFWVNNNNPIPVIGNTMYYVSGEDACTVYGWTASAGSTAIHTFEARGSNGWLVPGNHPLGANQTRLYYATGDAVYSIPVEGGMPVQEYWIDDENAIILYGYLNGSSMGLCVQDAETNDVTTHSFTIGQAAAVSLDQMLIELSEGKTVQLTAEAYPEDAEITWAAEGAAGVDETGLVTGLEAGAARVTATVGESVAECIVIVRSDEQIIVPDTVVEIKEGAFANSGAVDVVLPEGIEVIGDNAFKGCADLKIVAMPANFAENASVSETAFADCSGVTLLVKEGSFAHEYAVAAELDYILVP